jgi:hypothetical protein
MKRPTPTGFLLVGMAMALLGAICSASVLWGEHDWLGRFLLALIGGMSFAAAEALWWVRPWIGRAIDAWANAISSLLIFAALNAIYHAYRGGEVILLVAVTFMVTAAPCLLVRRYVRQRAAALGVLPAPGGGALQPSPPGVP